MNKVKELHRKAMEQLDQCLYLKREGRYGEIIEKANEALNLEIEAAHLTPLDQEPTRGVLYRSAASIAYYDCKKIDQSLDLIRTALNGNPYPRIKGELLEIITDIINDLKIEYSHLDNLAQKTWIK